jgi:hypothetical protein
MKTVLLLLIILAIGTNSAVAQVNNKALSKAIVVPGKEVRIDTLLNLLTRQTGIGFSFNSNKIRPSNTVTVPNAKQTLAQWLTILQQETGITHKVVGNHIILVDKKQPGSKTRPKRVATVSNVSVQEPRITSKQTAKRSFERSAGQDEGKQAVKAATINIDVASMGSGNIALSDSNSVIKSNTLPPDTIELTFITVDSLKEVKIKAVPVRENPTANNKATSPSTARTTNNPSLSLTPITKIGLGPEGLALSFERRLSNRMMIDLSLGAGGGYAITADQFKYKVGGLRGPDIYFSAHPRFYYNRKQRAINGKSQSRNAGNYFGFRLKYITDMMAENFVVWDAFLLNLHWGMQRPLGKRLVVSGHVGPGYATAQSIFYNTWLKGFSRFYPSIDLKISYVFSKNHE